METEARIFLEKIQRKILKRHPHIIKSIVVDELPGAEILQAVKDYQIDLVILGTRGLSKVKRFLLGSTSDWVMREAPCSVLLDRDKLSQVTMGKTPPKFLWPPMGHRVL
jgi:nucleotide-binding universal stress UspA family protein